MPRIPPARPADRSASRYQAASPSLNPAGSPGGSFGFRYPRPLLFIPNPAGSPGGSFGFRLPKDSCSSFPNPAGSPGGSFGFRLPKDSCSHVSESRRLARRIVRLPATQGQRSPSPIPPARPADRSASGYPRTASLRPQSRRLARRIVRLPATQGQLFSSQSRRLARRIVRLPATQGQLSPSPIPPARPADRSASGYQGQPFYSWAQAAWLPAGSPGGSFGFRL